MRRGLAIAVGLVGLLAAAIGAWWVSQPEVQLVWHRTEPTNAPYDAGAPHVVLVMLCTLRRDQLSIYDGPVEMASLEGLARDGVVVEDLVTAAPWTRPSVTAILTGHHAADIGMVEPAVRDNQQRLHESVTTLAERLAARGYDTWGTTANPNANHHFGMDQGFVGYLEPGKLWKFGMHKVDARTLLSDFFEVFDANRRARPQYLQMLLVDAHAPFDQDSGDLVADYQAGLRDFDARLSWVVQQLRDRGFTRDNTVLLVVSDHGEGLKAPPLHGKAHGFGLWPSQVHGVAMLQAPGLAPGRVSGVRSHLDVVPTVEAAIEGRLEDAPLIAPQEPGRAVFTQTWYQKAHQSGLFVEDTACIRDHVREKAGCHDRAADPEFRNRTANVDLMRELAEWEQEREAAMNAFPYAARAGKDADLQEQLRRLGYVE